MPIRWSALKVKEATDMIEKFVNQAVEPLEQARIVASEARKIENPAGVYRPALAPGYWRSRPGYRRHPVRAGGAAQSGDRVYPRELAQRLS